MVYPAHTSAAKNGALTASLVPSATHASNGCEVSRCPSVSPLATYEGHNDSVLVALISRSVGSSSLARYDSANVQVSAVGTSTTEGYTYKEVVMPSRSRSRKRGSSEALKVGAVPAADSARDACTHSAQAAAAIVRLGV